MARFELLNLLPFYTNFPHNSPRPNATNQYIRTDPLLATIKLAIANLL